MTRRSANSVSAAVAGSREGYQDYVSSFILNRLPTMGSRVDELQAVERRRQGLEVLPIKGAPMEPLPPHLIEAHTVTPLEAKYPPSRGMPELQQAISDLIGSQTGLTLDATRQVLVTNGAMQGLYVTMLALLNPGDEVIMPSPCFFFHEVVRLVGGNPITVPMSEEDEYVVNLERLEKAITPQTKALVLNTPLNPTGYVYSLKALEEVYRLAEDHDLLIVADEAYDRYIYDGRRHHTILEVPGAHRRTLLVRSFTKSYALGPWRIGYIVAPQPLIDVCTKVIQWMNLSVNYVSQKVALAALTGPQDWLAHLNAAWQANRDVLSDAVAEMKLVTSVRPRGGPFIFLNIEELSLSEDDFATVLLDRWGIPTTRGIYFNSPGHLRIPFGGDPATIEKLAQRLGEAVATIPRITKK